MFKAYAQAINSNYVSRGHARNVPKKYEKERHKRMFFRCASRI